MDFSIFSFFFFYGIYDKIEIRIIECDGKTSSIKTFISNLFSTRERIDAINILKVPSTVCETYITTSFQLLWYTTATADPECHNIHRNH